MKYLSIDQVLNIHERSVRQYSGETGVLSRKTLIDCLELPFTEHYGFKPYTSIWMKAAALLHCIIIRHPFVDGNKRTGWMTVILFLGVNDHYLLVSTDESEEFVLAIAMGELEIQNIASWMKEHAISPE